MPAIRRATAAKPSTRGGTSATRRRGPSRATLPRTPATYASFDIALEVEPGNADAEIVGAARALGESLTAPLRAKGVRGHGSAILPADEALANVVLEVSDRPAVFSNVDLSQARVGGLATDVAARFLDQLTESAGLTVHVRLIEGSDTQHVLEAIFKALGVALAEACGPRRNAT